MFKRGITTVEELTAAGGERTRIISAGLLLDLDDSDTEQAALLRNEIVRSLMLRNTTGKTTWGGRFREIDEEVASILRARFPTSLSGMEVGGSDGTTALELFKRLSGVADLHYLITDLNGSIFIRKGRFWTDVCDDDGRLIQTAIGPFVIPVTRISHLHSLQWVNRSIYLFASLFRAKKINRDWHAFIANRNGNAFEEFSLLTSEVQSMIASKSGLQFSRMDLFNPPPNDFDFIRMMNVLNLRVGKFGFSKHEVVQGLRNIAAMVREGGYLLLGRTAASSNGRHITHATLLEKTEGRLRSCRQFGSGSELEPFLDEL